MNQQRARSVTITTAVVALLALAALLGALLGESDDDGGSANAETVTVSADSGSDAAGQPATPGRGLNATSLYRREARGVVTVISVFKGSSLGSVLGGQGGEASGQGSGFVLNDEGEVATNAHVVLNTESGRSMPRAKEVYVEFADGNRVDAKIVGADPNSDIALLKVDPDGLDLHPLPLGHSRDVVVGAPVAAIGSPFGERQSLSVGVVSAVDRSIQSLTAYQVSGAFQTDAAINKGNSGGPLVNAQGEVIGINSQIRSESGTGSGVGFAIPVDLISRVLDQLRDSGEATYAYIGVSSVSIYPQLAERFKLPVKKGAWVQTVTAGGPAGAAGLKPGSRDAQVFQAQPFNPGGDVITKVGDTPVESSTDLSEAIAKLGPNDTAKLEVYRGGDKRTIDVKLRERPLTQPTARPR